MTDQPYGFFTPGEYQRFIRSDADALLTMLADADRSAPVPACPDWTVRGLIEHLGGVLQWVQHRGLGPSDEVRTVHTPVLPAEAEDLSSWFEGCVSDLLKVLSTTDPAKPCWTIQPDYQVAAFWSRRMSHEMAMHRKDLAVALGGSYFYESGFAVDGVAEVLDVLIPSLKMRRQPPLNVPAPVLIECTDRPERWLLAPEPGDPESHRASGPSGVDGSAAAAAVRGPAAGLLLSMWKRQDADVAGLTFAGDVDLARRLLSARLTP